jgi:glycosyltransferase involved in cell wall biosynthesis
MTRPRTIVVMPAYTAGQTLERTVLDIPSGTVDEVILCDDFSSDNTVAIANRLGLTVIRHHVKKGYGANQKACYGKALEREQTSWSWFIPDYQYDPA